MLVKAIIINRNLLTTLKNTVEFLRKEKRVEIHILDQNSNYPDLLKWYKTIPEKVHYLSTNNGPYIAWDDKFKNLRNNYFIVTDPDCNYDDVPLDWLDKMLSVLNTLKNNVFKVGFSLDIDDLPNSEIGIQAYNHEKKYWHKKIELGWDAHIDTTFALYKPKTPFSYNGLRLDKPYCIKHIPWYLTNETITDEWLFYLKNASSVSTWGSKLKLKLEKKN